MSGLDDATSAAITICIPPGSAVLTAGSSSPSLLDALRARSCRIVEEDAPTGPVDAAVLTTRVDLLDDVATDLASLTSRIGADGRIVVVAPAAGHVARRLDLAEPSPTSERRGRNSEVSWPSIASTLTGAGLHVWWFLPVRTDVLAGTGVDASAISPDVRAAVAGSPTADVDSVVVVAGRQAGPPAGEEATMQLACEVDRAWTAFDEERRRASDTSDVRLAEMRRQIDDLDARLHVALAERDATRLQVAASAEQLIELDQRWQTTQRGFARLGLSLDRRMLSHPRLRRLHAALGRIRRV